MIKKIRAQQGYELVPTLQKYHDAEVADLFAAGDLHWECEIEVMKLINQIGIGEEEYLGRSRQDNA